MNDRVHLMVCGRPVDVAIQNAWSDIGAITTAARWKAGCGSKPFDLFETRDSAGRLLHPQARIGSWLHNQTLHVNLLPGVGS